MKARLGILAIHAIRVMRVWLNTFLVCTEVRVTPWANGWRAVEAAKAAAFLKDWSPVELLQMMGGSMSVAEVWREMGGNG
jgi:hypothetical protein